MLRTELAIPSNTAVKHDTMVTVLLESVNLLMHEDYYHAVTMLSFMFGSHPSSRDHLLFIFTMLQCCRKFVLEKLDCFISVLSSVMMTFLLIKIY